MRERTNCGRGCSFSFFSYMKKYKKSQGTGQEETKKTCRKKQHVKIDIRKGMSDLICGIFTVGGNYNLTYDNNAASGAIIEKLRNWDMDSKSVKCNSGRMNMKRYLSLLANTKLRMEYLGF